MSLFDKPGGTNVPFREDLAVRPTDPALVEADGVVVGVVVDPGSKIGTALLFQFFSAGQKVGPEILLTGWHGTLITLLADAQHAQAQVYEGRER